MAKIVSRVKQLRLEYQMKERRDISVGEVAEGVGITRTQLSRIENDRTEQITFDLLAKLCMFYTRVLGRPVTPNDVLEYDPNNKRAPELAVA